MEFEKVAVLGGGLLGGSLAMALKRDFPGLPVSLWARRPATVAEALQRGIAGATADLAEAVKGADLVVLSTPVGAMAAVLLAAQSAGLSPDALITDVGSVKVAPHRDLAPILAQSGNPFIGSHPMAGSERNGLAAARADLFENAACLLTNDSGASSDLCEALEDFWKSLGCRTKWLAAPEHDRLVARISHLPHVTAAATAFGALSADTASGNLSGGGLRDTTRVAGGNPEMWAEILTANREAVLKSADAMIESLREIANILARDAGDPALLEFLKLAKHRRAAAAHLTA